MALDFNGRILITNPTSFLLGRLIGLAGLASVAFGIVTSFTGDYLLPASAWCALGVPLLVIGIIVARSGVRLP